MTTNSWATEARHGFVDFNLYPYLSDVDNDNSLTINSLAIIDDRWSYFGFINFSNESNASELSDFDNFYTEQNIRWKLAEESAFDITAQFNLRSGENNDRHRLGVRWRLNDSELSRSFLQKLHLQYSINLHALQFDHDSAYVWQMEHAFTLKFPYLSDRLYLSGFIDHTFNETLSDDIPSNPIVGEAQLGLHLFDGFYLIAEYRLNQYRRTDVNNLAVGVEYQLSW